MTTMNHDRMIVEGVEAMEGHVSNAIDIASVRSELLSHNRDMVRSSKFRTNLGRIQEALDTIEEEPGRLSPIASATNPQEMQRAIFAERLFPGEVTPTWANQSNWLERALLIGTPFALGVFLAFFVSGMLGPLLAIPSFLATILFLIHFGEKDSYPVNFRNKVIYRKAYKREIERLLGVAKNKRDRHAQLRGIRQAKLRAARKALGPMAQDFAIDNPGKTLAIVNKDTKPFIQVTDDASYTPLDSIATMMIDKNKEYND